jgi:tRNA/rRNA methyltransferase
VLVRPYGGANVGAVCRAMKNMGAGALTVVGGEFDLDQARRTAVHASDVLESRLDTDSLAQAISGCSVVVGTTARAGGYRERVCDIRELAGEIARAERGAAGVPALVFGPEDSGLTNADIALCHRLAFIPADAGYLSLNLAQAVLVCLYELMRARAGLDADRASRDEEHPRADAAEVEAMYGALEQALLAIGFLADDNPKHVMMTLRALVGRAGPDEREVRVLRGIARQITWFADGGYETARRKRERGEKLR